jgi:hypothetical protein
MLSFVELTVVKAADPTQTSLLSVYESSTIAGAYYFRLRFREFRDEELILRSEMGGLEWYIQNDIHDRMSIHDRDGAMLTDRDANVFIWDLSD